LLVLDPLDVHPGTRFPTREVQRLGRRDVPDDAAFALHRGLGAAFVDRDVELLELAAPGEADDPAVVADEHETPVERIKVGPAVEMTDRRLRKVDLRIADRAEPEPDQALRGLLECAATLSGRSQSGSSFPASSQAGSRTRKYPPRMPASPARARAC
jgi:hypothetical protein